MAYFISTKRPLGQDFQHKGSRTPQKLPSDCFNTTGFRKSQTSCFYDGSMSHQKNCYRLGVVSYSSDPSGDRLGPLVGVLEAILRHYDRVAGLVTPQRNRSRGRGHTAPIVTSWAIGDSLCRVWEPLRDSIYKETVYISYCALWTVFV